MSHTPERFPFEIDRSALPWLRIRNVSSERVRGVGVIARHGNGDWVVTPHPLAPGESSTIAVPKSERLPDGFLVVRWFTSCGVEYVWRISV